ncbi:hypothetical protein K443DRAFT_15056, partial [Laccaria amethystina LaAM-08-1]
MATLAKTTDSNSTRDPSALSAVAIDSSHVVTSEPTSSATLTTLAETTDSNGTSDPSTSSAVGINSSLASEPGTPSTITTGSANAPVGDVLINTARPSRKRKLPNSIPTLVAAKIPAAVGPDGRP